MEIREALELARKVILTGERVELIPTADGAEVDIIKRRKAKQKTETASKRGGRSAESG